MPTLAARPRRSRSNLEALLGERVAALRLASGLTQAQLAEHAELTTRYVMKIEAGATSPSLRSIEGLASALHVTVSELFTFEKAPPRRRLLGRPPLARPPESSLGD
jgi:transcriptional regulator with XRE-family HTH domain